MKPMYEYREKATTRSKVHTMAQAVYRREDLASYLLRHSDQIMQRWEDEVRSTAEQFRIFDRLALRNSLSHVLDYVARVIIQQGKPDTEALPEMEGHGKIRAALHQYSLAQVLTEFNLLRQVIFEELDANFVLTAKDRNNVLEAMAHALSGAASGYFENKTRVEAGLRSDAEAGRNRAEGSLRDLQTEIDQLRLDKGSLERNRDESRAQVKVLETASDLKNKFILMLSHDLRNPLGTVKMALEILTLELRSSQRIDHLVSIMNRNLERADSMIRDLLDANRIRSGRGLSLEVEQHDLVQIAQEALEDLVAQYGKRFALKSAPQVLGYWNGSNLRRVIENLASNAVKYGQRDEPIAIGISQNDQCTTLTVHNAGKPIPLQDQSTLFDPFFRTKSADSENNRGWGIGLTLVRGVAESHGGHAEVRSTAKDGTTFTVTLPNDARSIASTNP